jgi:catechol 2,3-dioxygenase-like lactoylglutathione lyase family enzyme
MKIDSLDHLVLTVKDVDATASFYSSVLGMDIVTFAGGRKALSFDVQKINLHQRRKEFEPKAPHLTPGSADLCFITSVPPPEVIRHLSSHNVAMIEGPVRRAGATGSILSVYFRDPDMNLIDQIACLPDVAFERDRRQARLAGSSAPASPIYPFPKTLSAAATVSAMSASLCADETKPDSKGDGAK